MGVGHVDDLDAAMKWVQSGKFVFERGMGAKISKGGGIFNFKTTHFSCVLAEKRLYVVILSSVV